MKKKITIIDISGMNNYFSDGRCETSNKHYLTNYPPIMIANINSVYDVDYITRLEDIKNVASETLYIQTTVTTFKKDMLLAQKFLPAKKLVFFGNNIDTIKTKKTEYKFVSDIEEHLLGDIPFADIVPDWSFLKEEYKIPFVGKKFLVVETSRGCAFRCSFCTEANKKIVNKPIGKIIHEIKNARNKYGVEAIIFKSACFTEDKERTINICKEIINNKLNKDIVFLCNSRISSMDEERIKWMKKANFFMIAFGIETVNKESQKKINKVIDMDYAKSVFRMLNKYGILIWAHFIVFPWETKKDQIDKIRFAKKNAVDFIQILPLYILPRTKLASLKEFKKNRNITNNAEDALIRWLYLNFYVLNFNLRRILKISNKLKMYNPKNAIRIVKLLLKKETFV